jgi:hypothetical protein
LADAETLTVNTDAAPKVSIIVLNWNRKADTLECLESLRRMRYPNYEVVVVDNGSTDDSVETIKQAHPHVTVLQNSDNLGYAEGNNVGVHHAWQSGSDYAFILNNDAVVSANTLTPLVETMEREPDVAIVGSRICYYHRRDIIQCAGTRADEKTGATIEEVGNGQQDTGQEFPEESYNSAHGCAMMVRCSLLEKVGLMEPAFCLYLEEEDWCLRFQEAGYRVKMIATSKVFHKDGATIGGSKSPPALYYMARNRRLFLENRMRHQGKTLPLKKYLLPQLREYVELLERGYYNSATAWLIGIGDAVRQRYGRKDNLKWDSPLYRALHKAVFFQVRLLRAMKGVLSRGRRTPLVSSKGSESL